MQIILCLKAFAKQKINMEQKFIIFKTIKSFGSYFVREFDNLDDAKKFTTLMRESETYDFVSYSISQVVNF